MSGRRAVFSADTVAAGRRFDEELRARAQVTAEGDAYREGARVLIDGMAATVLGRHPRTQFDESQRRPVRFVMELDRELAHGRRVVAADATRMRPLVEGAPVSGS